MRCTLVALICLVGLGASLPEALAAQAADLRSPAFDYRDVDRFGEAIRRIHAGAAPEEAFRRYLEGAGPGLYGWTQRYSGLTGARYAELYARFPKYFEYLGSLRSELEAREEGIAAGLVRLREVVSGLYDWHTLSILPTYYFVTPMGGGGSAEPIANMIAVDYYGRNSNAPLEELEELGFWPDGKLSIQNLDAMEAIAAHEMVHWYQSLLQGELGYVALYLEPGADTLLARAVREGGADFVASLATGKVQKAQREYGEQHETELWRAFRAQMEELSDDHPGWFSGRNEAFPDAPWQIGYWLGMRMCRAYYEGSEDRDEALRTILTTDDPEVYRAMAKAYDEALTID